MTDDPVINTTIDRASHTILVVDDHPTTRYATTRIVRAAGFQTQEASTGTEALKLAKGRISAIVLDVHLPDIDGFGVCRELRADVATMTLPIVHLSATFVRNEDKVMGLEAGADAYMIHPVEPPVLIATLQALIRARMAEERMRGSEARFRAIYDQAPSGMALIGDDGRFVDVNPALATMLGRRRSDLVGRPVTAFSPQDWVTFVKEQAARMGVDTVSWKGEFPLLKSDGSPVELEWTVSAHIEPGLRVGIALDVSERLELERRRREVLEREQAARAAAEHQSRTKDDFVAVLSHELRNPINAIGGWVHVLRKGVRSAEQLEKGLSAIDRSVKAQARLISDILDVSRISSGKLRLHREWVQPGALVLESIDALKSAAAAKELEIRFSPPAVDEPAWLDGTRFQQVVWNLLSNAIKFSNTRGQINVDLSRDENHLRLSVQDFGRGIRRDFLPHLFERFTQSESPDSRLHGGLGLGLSIVKNLAELHGGTISAESPGEGKGAVFHVTLDVAPGAGKADDAQDVRAANASDALDVRLEDVDVLVVEDNADAREILAMVLSEAGARVRHAADYDHALALVHEKWPDILVSDIGLSGRDGYELMRALRDWERQETKPRIFAVAHTAFTRPQDNQKAADAGFDAHLGKPLQPHALLTLIASSSRA
jgi:PAS domain S-box-containing protein